MRSSKEILEHPLIRRLGALSLNRADFVIFGSTPLWVHGFRSTIRDLDVVARGEAWDRALHFGETLPSSWNNETMVHFWGGQIEVFSEWLPPCWDTDDLINRADLVAGFRFARLADVMAYKKFLRRAKDIRDIYAYRTPREMVS